MAGESVMKIKEKERESADAVSAAKADAKKIVQRARDERPAAFARKDELLERDEQIVRERYQKESKRAIEELQADENRTIGEIDDVCARNLEAVTAYLAVEIVKE